MPMNLYLELEKSFLRNSSKFVFEDKLTYGDLLEVTNQTSIDLEPGSILLAELSSGPLFIKILLAALRNKLIFCPIASDSGDFQRAESILKPNAIFKQDFKLIHPELNSQIMGLCPDGGFVRFTSGTTAQAKGVLISSQSAAERIKAVEKNFKLSTNDKVLFLMSMPYHFVTSLLMMLKNGVTFTESPEQATVVYATPFHYQSLLSANLPNLRLAVSTSTHLPEIISREFVAKFKIPIRQSYGIIEVGLPIGDFENSSSDSVGRVLEDYEIKFFDGEQDSGILAIKGPGLFDAYLKPFKLRADILRDGWFVTGDLARRDSAGNVFIQGRNTSVIHLGGFKIFPEEIEDVLIQHPKVKEAQVFSETHQIYGNTIVAKIVCKEELDLKEIRTFCRERLGVIRTPKRFEIIEKLAKTSSGKLSRKNNSEVIIIGAGLAGCTVGTLLSRAGFDITIYDHGSRPDLVVGESLIPALIPVLRRLGIEEEVKTYAVKKPGATIYLDSSIEWRMSFSDFDGDAYAYNVPRKEFDETFKRLAINSGCKFEKAHIGREILCSNAFLIDASGRSRFLANTLDIPAETGSRKDLAIFAHFEGVEIKHPGNIHMNVDPAGWFWRIPLPGKVSVGIVVSADILNNFGNNTETQFDRITQEVIGKHLVGAKRITKVMKYQNYQLVNSKMVGQNWACAGDAAGFADPVFSSGVFLALTGAAHLADSIIENGFSNLTAYEEVIKTELRNWKSIIECFYDGRFLSMIRHGAKIDHRRLLELRSLVAQVMGGFADKKALEMFFEILNHCDRNQSCSNY